jgi:parvulin-like peptidyl-prolyl isomerase
VATISSKRLPASFRSVDEAADSTDDRAPASRLRGWTTSRKGTFLLAAGAALGIGLAAAGLVSGRRGAAGPLPPGAVASVNGEIIRTQDYERVLSTIAHDRRDGQDPLNKADRRRVVDRLIDEELLVQRGLELGMALHDGKVRKDLTSAVIDSVVADFTDVQPTDKELKAFYDQNRAFFAGPGRVRVRQIFFRARTTADAPMAFDRAQQALKRLRGGEDFAAVRNAVGDPALAPLPDALLPPAKLVDYLGPTAARAALSLQVGAISDPVRSSTGFHILQLLDRQPEPSPPLDQIKPQVAAEFRRRASEKALRSYLDDLRSRARVKVASKLP